jgi:hypothetical protein
MSKKKGGKNSSIRMCEVFNDEVHLDNMEIGWSGDMKLELSNNDPIFLGNNHMTYRAIDAGFTIMN